MHVHICQACANQSVDSPGQQTYSSNSISFSDNTCSSEARVPIIIGAVIGVVGLASGAVVGVLGIVIAVKTKRQVYI